jgi:energy-converting hydrogenase B subunit D
VTPLDLVVDGLLALTTLLVAGLALFHRRVFACVVLFIVYGMLLALIWLRLSAPDVALAEAAIGAGITGALLIGTLWRLSSEGAGRHDARHVRNRDG